MCIIIQRFSLVVKVFHTEKKLEKLDRPLMLPLYSFKIVIYNNVKCGHLVKLADICNMNIFFPIEFKS